jgi:4-hydroxybenzoate adenylyltransferase
MTAAPIAVRTAVRPVNVAGDLAALAARNGWLDNTAFLVDDQAWTHGAVHDLAARATSVLVDHGVRPGDRVLLAMPDGIGWVTTFLAVARLGAVAVLANPELTAADHSLLAEDSAARLCVTGSALRGRFDRWLDVADLLARAGTAGAAGVQWVDPDTPLYIQYTSGTTGEPKGAVHTHEHLPVYYDAVGGPVLGIGPADVTLSVSKLFFAYGFGNAFVFPLYSGSSAVLVADRPPAERIAELVARHRVTMLYAVPSAYAALVAQADRAAFGSVRGAVSAGETLSPALGERATDLLGAPIYEQIGSTEAGHAFCANGVYGNATGTIGWPVPGYELELRGKDGRPVPDGAEGELWVRGPTLLREYLNRPEQTATVLVDGWLATRDLASRQPDGTYRHHGRADDLEMVGGITVSPLEIERLLEGHPRVGEVAVAAVRDSTGATKLRAFVVPTGSATDLESLPADLIGLAREHLAAFKVPRTVQIVPALPRTATGKLRRHIVRTGSW